MQKAEQSDTKGCAHHKANIIGTSIVNAAMSFAPTSAAFSDDDMEETRKSMPARRPTWQRNGKRFKPKAT